MANQTIRQALVYVTNHPVMVGDPIDAPVWELVARGLFDMANRPDPSVRGAMAKATKAQSMLADRLVGKRRAGSRPMNGEVKQVEFVDLTVGEIGKDPVL